jgi:hypothetical protein
MWEKQVRAEIGANLNTPVIRIIVPWFFQFAGEIVQQPLFGLWEN